MKHAIFWFTMLGFVWTMAVAQEQQFLRGRTLQGELVGNTLYVHHPGCTDVEANFILYFAEDGKAFAKERACRLPADRAMKLQGSWSMAGSDFCIRQMGEVKDHCLTLVKIGDNTYKRIDTTGVRTDWSMAVLEEGNPEGF